MSGYGQKPENALRRAMELKGIQQSDLALSTLHEVLSSRRHRTWSPTYEKIMIAYIDLCLELNKPREAKDGLHQYRNLSQSQAPGSLENVIRYLIKQSESRCMAAKASVDKDDEEGGEGGEESKEEEMKESSALAAGDLDADDAGAADSTNMLLLSTMTADPEQNQKESATLLPRIKFLWEAYRAVLDILKSNSKLERLYHDTAIGVLKFCATYKRRTEFRRLCDLLRTHFQNLQKYGGTKEMARVNEGGKQNSKVSTVSIFLFVCLFVCLSKTVYIGLTKNFALSNENTFRFEDGKVGLLSPSSYNSKSASNN